MSTCPRTGCNNDPDHCNRGYLCDDCDKLVSDLASKYETRMVDEYNTQCEPDRDLARECSHAMLDCDWTDCLIHTVQQWKQDTLDDHSTVQPADVRRVIEWIECNHPQQVEDDWLRDNIVLTQSYFSKPPFGAIGSLKCLDLETEVDCVLNESELELLGSLPTEVRKAHSLPTGDYATWENSGEDCWWICINSKILTSALTATLFDEETT